VSAWSCPLVRVRLFVSACSCPLVRVRFAVSASSCPLRPLRRAQAGPAACPLQSLSVTVRLPCACTLLQHRAIFALRVRLPSVSACHVPRNGQAWIGMAGRREANPSCLAAPSHPRAEAATGLLWRQAAVLEHRAGTRKPDRYAQGLLWRQAGLHGLQACIKHGRPRSRHVPRNHGQLQC
jgi:hypothetical protein